MFATDGPSEKPPTNGSSPGLVGREQGLLQRPGTAPSGRVVLQLQGLQPPGFSEGFGPEEPRLRQHQRGAEEHGARLRVGAAVTNLIAPAVLLALALTVVAARVGAYRSASSSSSREAGRHAGASSETSSGG